MLSWNATRTESSVSGQEPRNRLVGTLTETANPCYCADIGNVVEWLYLRQLAKDYFSQTSFII